MKWAALEKWLTILRIMVLPAEGGNPVTKSKAMWGKVRDRRRIVRFGLGTNGQNKT